MPSPSLETALASITPYAEIFGVIDRFHPGKLSRLHIHLSDGRWLAVENNVRVDRTDPIEKQKRTVRDDRDVAVWGCVRRFGEYGCDPDKRALAAVMQAIKKVVAIEIAIEDARYGRLSGSSDRATGKAPGGAV